MFACLLHVRVINFQDVQNAVVTPRINATLSSQISARRLAQCLYQTRLSRRYGRCCPFHGGVNLTLRLQLLQEIEQSAAASQQQITVVKAQIASKTRETRLIQLTTKELAPLPQETKVYEGVGRM